MTSTSDTMALHIPFCVLKRGGRRVVQIPNGSAAPARADSTLVKALARAFRWKRMLDSGDFMTLAELARQEQVTPSFLSRILRLTLLAPDIIEAILDEKQDPELALAPLMQPFPVEWDQQAEYFR